MSISSLLSHSRSLSADLSAHYPVLHWGLLRGDNYGYFLQTGLGEVVAVDVPDGQRMLSLLVHKNWQLTDLLLTHTHHDHVVGLDLLLQESGCRFYHPEGAELSRPGTGVKDGDKWQVNGLQVQAMDTSGHSPLDFSYYFSELELLFCGDTLFSWGCGRMFAGPPARFWNSLKSLRSLPESTRICCGHDYAGDNHNFVQQTFSGMSELDAEPEEGGMPLLLREQCLRNPFLRADDPQIAKAIGMFGADEVEVFKTLRERRNQL